MHPFSLRNSFFLCIKTMLVNVYVQWHSWVFVLSSIILTIYLLLWWLEWLWFKLSFAVLCTVLLCHLVVLPLDSLSDAFAIFNNSSLEPVGHCFVQMWWVLLECRWEVICGGRSGFLWPAFCWAHIPGNVPSVAVFKKKKTIKNNMARPLWSDSRQLSINGYAAWTHQLVRQAGSVKQLFPAVFPRNSSPNDK